MVEFIEFFAPRIVEDRIEIAANTKIAIPGRHQSDRDHSVATGTPYRLEEVAADHVG